MEIQGLGYNAAQMGVPTPKSQSPVQGGANGTKEEATADKWS